MVTDIIENEEYKNIMCEHARDIIIHLIESGEEFAITANIKGLTFTPELPSSISDKLAQFSLFVLSNYTFESIRLDEDNFYFEAGFGKENFGSVVKVPFFAVFQIIVDESILFVNPIATVEKYFKDHSYKERSMNAFKMNKKNKELLEGTE